MDVFNSYGLGIGFTIGVLSGVYTFLNKSVQESRIQALREDNDDLRKRRDDVIQERDECEKEVIRLKATTQEQLKRISEIKQLNSKQPDFAGLTKLISNNHKEVLTELIKLTKVISKV